MLALIVWLVGIPLAHGAAPWAMSSFTRRYGWTEGWPGIWNLLGLIPVIGGIALLVWVLVVGLVETPRRTRLGLTPSYLLTRGPYTFTRNSMYLAELGLWLGWAFFYGSVPVSIAFVVFAVVVNVIVVPHEEQTLEAQFGTRYRRYKENVPRWLGKAQALEPQRSLRPVSEGLNRRWF
ncbi:MAG: methyltransferase [Acidobacteriota bacterium]